MMTLFFINIGKTWIWTLMSIHKSGNSSYNNGWLHLPARRRGRQGRHWLSFPSLCIYTACPRWGGSFLQILPGNAVTHPSRGRPLGSFQILSSWQSRWTVTSTLQKIYNTCMEPRHMSPHMLNTPCITHEPQGYVNARKILVRLHCLMSNDNLNAVSVHLDAFSLFSYFHSSCLYPLFNLSLRGNMIL